MRPNIIYIHSHDSGRYLQPYGHAIPTPAIQALAEGGVLFRQAYCAAPTCSASRAALLTGKCSHSAGMLGLTHRGFGSDDFSHHLVNTLKPAGYHTALAGVQHVARKPEDIGYDEVFPRDRTAARVVASRTADWLADKPREPFFLDVGFSETHRVFAPPYPAHAPAEDERYCMPPALLPDTPRTRADIASFKASARHLDDGVGMVMEALARSGLAENTIVISTTDHGIAFPEMKCNLTDHGIGVSLIIKAPQNIANGVLAGGRVCDALVSQIDLFPTICDLAGIDKPQWLQGTSLLPLLAGEREEVNDAIFAEVNFHPSFEPMRCVRTRRWKYIRRFHERRNPVLCHCDDNLSKIEWLESGWGQKVLSEEELFDLCFDPVERNNRAGDPSCEAILNEMRERLDRWMRETSDPLLEDVFPVPADARVNDVNSLAPEGATVPDPQGYANAMLTKWHQRTSPSS